MLPGVSYIVQHVGPVTEIFRIQTASAADVGLTSEYWYNRLSLCLTSIVSSRIVREVNRLCRKGQRALLRPASGALVLRAIV